MTRATGFLTLILTCLPAIAQEPDSAGDLLGADFELANTVPPLRALGSPKDLPFADKPFEEHVRVLIPGGIATGVTKMEFRADGTLVANTDGSIWEMAPGGRWSKQSAAAMANPDSPLLHGLIARDSEAWGQSTWFATDVGLYISSDGVSPAERHRAYGVGGPLATQVTSLALVDDRMFVGSPRGISICDADGNWTPLTGKQGLPFEDVTALESDGRGSIWIGTTSGAILYRPDDPERQWYFRWGQRYLPGNHVTAIAVAADGTPYFATDGGIGAIALTKTTMEAKAETIEARVNERHRRLGLVAECELDDPLYPTTHVIKTQPNDGLWTAYHVAAMALAYGATGDPAAKASAREGMHALYMLQDVSGTPGLVARSVLPPDEYERLKNVSESAEGGRGLPAPEDWYASPNGDFYWRSDCSSDEIDGHYLAFYTYWTHIAKDDPAERDLCIAHAKALTDVIIANGYRLIDVDGEQTRWGVWYPEALNDDPEWYLENGLNALQILSFLKTAHTITGDPAYKDHFRTLAVDHHYLSNLLLSKKVFPDSNNHSDNQLGHVAWYPLIQQEKDPKVRAALHAGLRRHYRIVEAEKPSFFTFVYATIDPNHADIEAGVENLREIPEDRRNWEQKNSHRADIAWSPRLDRFDDPQLLEVLPADERSFRKWNRNPYLADDGTSGTLENDGAAYLLPYWMGRYHGFIAPAS